MPSVCMGCLALGYDTVIAVRCPSSELLGCWPPLRLLLLCIPSRVLSVKAWLLLQACGVVSGCQRLAEGVQSCKQAACWPAQQQGMLCNHSMSCLVLGCMVLSKSSSHV
jgi:hypothetical protein